MKLYVQCPYCNYRTHVVGSTAENRSALAEQIGSPYFTMRCQHCKITESHYFNDVYAEGAASSILSAALIVGIVGGMISGPIGMLLCGIFGTALGAGIDLREAVRVRNFNASQVIE